MMLQYDNQEFNIKIRIRSDGEFALGVQRENEDSFESLESLIKFYSPGIKMLELYQGCTIVGKTFLFSL